MSPAVTEVIHQHVARALARPDIKEVLAKTGHEVLGMPPADTLQEARAPMTTGAGSFPSWVSD